MQVVKMVEMDFSDDEIQRSVRKWMRIAGSDGPLPVILMPFDPEGGDSYEPDYSALFQSGRPAG